MHQFEQNPSLASIHCWHFFAKNLLPRRKKARKLRAVQCAKA